MSTLPPVSGPVSSARSDEFEGLFDHLLYAVSHDLRSPMLSIGLGAELLEGSGADERTRLGVESIQRGHEDLVRLLDALTQVSRARRRPLDAQPVPLASLVPDATGLESVAVRVDPRIVAELAAVVGAPRVVIGDEDVRLIAALPGDIGEVEGPPLEALFASLGLHAGTTVAALAVIQVQLERQGGTLVLGGGQATALLPASVAVAGSGA